MSDELLVQCASPTLAGIKTGNIFTCRFELKKQLTDYIRRVNKCLVPKGIRVIPLRVKENSALLYMYRPEKLREDLKKDDAKRLLEAVGYKKNTMSGCLGELMCRMSGSEDFPHEIGLFIGYPPEDVKGFIEGRPDYKCIGCWKVYGDENSAKKTFDRFRRCREIYQKEYKQGRTLNSLAVSM